ncbi:MAG: hypothetical protein ACJZ8O_08945 [Pirellulaceae bacterium]
MSQARDLVLTPLLDYAFLNRHAVRIGKTINLGAGILRTATASQQVDEFAKPHGEISRTSKSR